MIRIGTRESQLALWQAQWTQKLLADKNITSELVPIQSKGDIVLDKPLYELGITGIFTKTLDLALLNHEIDIAVHSLKDVPTALPHGMEIGAYLPRANHTDVLVYKNKDFFTNNSQKTIATGSLRRKAFWLNKYPNDNLVDLRGNVQTRLQKLDDNTWDGAIFAYAGLERSKLFAEIKKRNYFTLSLDWMTAAPAQGIVAIAVLTENKAVKDIISQLNHTETQIEATLERQFLRTIEGGCTTPIGAKATILGNKIDFLGNILSLDGQQIATLSTEFSTDEIDGKAAQLAHCILHEKRGKVIYDEVKKYFDAKK